MNKIEIIKKAIEDKTGKKTWSRNLTNESIIFESGNIKAPDLVMILFKSQIDLLPISDPLEEQPDKGWIPVSERLPKLDGSGNCTIVLLFSDERPDEFEIGYYSVSSKKWFKDDDGVEFIDDITHWQPLPNPPQAPVKQG